jgi:ribokinase
MSTKICVVGSINMDLVVRASRFPSPGETLLGGPFHAYPGGKGANQAVAASRMGAEVSLVGCVGRPYGDELLAALDADGVDTRGVRHLEDVATGVGVITVVPSGENAIVVASGANARLSPADVEDSAEVIEAADAVVLQLEVPEESTQRAIEIARAAGKTTFLNAAPARPLRRELLFAGDVVIVNRVEAEMLTGREAGTPEGELLRALHDLGAAHAVVTLGEQGAVHSGGGAITHQDTFPVEAVDTTACGDAFVGTFSVATGEGMPPEESLGLACAAGALAARSPGAMPSMPNRDVVEGFLRGAG